MSDEPPLSADRVRSLVIGHAHSCLGALLQAGGEPRPEAAACADAGWTVVVIAYPTPAGDGSPGLSPCERDCLTLLARVQEPLPAARVRKEMERSGLAVHAEITVKRSLARLKRLGLVDASRTGKRGYFLPDHGPLFRHPPDP